MYIKIYKCTIINKFVLQVQYYKNSHQLHVSKHWTVLTHHAIVDLFSSVFCVLMLDFSTPEFCVSFLAVVAFRFWFSVLRWFVRCMMVASEFMYCCILSLLRFLTCDDRTLYTLRANLFDSLPTVWTVLVNLSPLSTAEGSENTNNKVSQIALC